jgi:hypothetical protein
MPRSTEIENYEPSDDGWQVAIGPLRRPELEPVPPDHPKFSRGVGLVLRNEQELEQRSEDAS